MHRGHRKILISITIGGLIILVGAYSMTAIAEPIHSYDFTNGSILDTVGGSQAINHGARFVDGEGKRGLYFDGVDDYVEVVDSAYNHEGITVSALIDSYSPHGNRHSIIVTQGDGPNPKEGFSLRYGYNYDLRFMIGNGQGFDGTDAVIVDQFPALVVGTFDGSEVNVYVNGELLSTKRIPEGVHTEVPLGIGGNLYAGGFYFSGTIGNVRIYDRALDATQIRLLGSVS